MEALERRQLMAAVDWSVGFSGASNLVDQATRDKISDFVVRTGNEWAALIDQDPSRGNVTLQVIVVLDGSATGSTGRLSAKSLNNVQVGGTTSTLFDQRATAFARYGKGNAVGADIQLNIDPNYLASSLWFDPNPDARSTGQATPVPSGKIDAYSAILHEMGHAFFFNGLLDEQTYQPDDPQNPNDRSAFDKNVTFIGGDPFFTGSQAEAANGGQPVPLTRQNMYHFGNKTGAGTNLLSTLMNGNEFNFGQRYFIGNVERGLAQDVLLTGTRPPPVIDGTNDPTPVTFTLQQNASFNYTSSNNVVVTITQKGSRTTTVLTFAPGTSLTDPVGDPLAVEVTSSDASSSLVFDSGSAMQIGKLRVPGGRGIKAIIAPNVTITDTSDITGAMQLTLGQIKKTSLTVGNVMKNGVFSLGVVTESDVKLPMTKSVTLTRFTPVDMNGQKLAIAAAQSLTVTGDLAGRVEVSGLLPKITAGSMTDATVVMTGNGGTVSVAGPVTGTILSAAKWGNMAFGAAVSQSTITSTGTTLANITATGDVSGSLISARTAAGKVTLGGTLASSSLLAGTMVTSVTVGGAMTGSTVLGQTGLGTVSVSSSAGSRILAGFSPTGTLPTTLPTSLPAFTSAKASIKSVSAKQGTFSSTLIIAPMVGSVTVGNVATDNGGVKFGIVTKSLGGFVSTTPSMTLKKTSKATNAGTGDLVVAVLTA
jgi:hypothetical protein